MSASVFFQRRRVLFGTGTYFSMSARLFSTSARLFCMSAHMFLACRRVFFPCRYVVFASRLTRRPDTLFLASFCSSFDILLSGMRLPRVFEHFFSFVCSFLLFCSFSLAQNFCSSRSKTRSFAVFERVLCWKGRFHCIFTGDSTFFLLFLRFPLSQSLVVMTHSFISNKASMWQPC